MNTPTPQAIAEMAIEAKAWPYQEAKSIIARLKKSPRPKDQPVVFETGYGPSGLPHIGTFGEVMRTSVVRYAFNLMSDHPTRLIVFSDDMDGLRKVPDNIPNKELIGQYLNFPLTRVPDPFGQEPSFGEYNNAMLRRFLDSFGFEYTFLSSSDEYRAGRFDQALRRMLKVYDKVQKIMLPTLGEERRESYSPFFPICPETGHVLQVPVLEINAENGTITYQRDDGKTITTEVTGGQCKLQWKPDWAMRWYALGVDYEMSGKDLIDSVKAANRIVRALGGTPPEGISYEHFLDQDGQKISKSKGNGLSIDEWLEFGPPEALSLFMYQKPKTAKRLYFDIIPKATDEYAQYLAAAHKEDYAKILENPAFVIHSGDLPEFQNAPSFSMILNLVTASDSSSKEQLWGFLKRYDETLLDDNAWVDKLIDYAIAYYEKFVKPSKEYREPDAQIRGALNDLAEQLSGQANDAEALQQLMFDIGKAHSFEPIRHWFTAFYQVLLGQNTGPRAGSFIALYGVEATIALINTRLS